MKKISLTGISFSDVLSADDLRKIQGGLFGSGDLCEKDSLGICGGNCQRPGGAADKCRPKSSGTDDCTCGGV
ncbi:hypothetical protein SAMN05444682_103473 [Parapedobacter indicus]|uniref:Uncharacterized protein n=1 Tax=Parapedobacter indicus TaxID=1477437 RepID=A0A1I3HSW5_9SPHI|nr:hypothetical protein CLV26_103474 [Parapedobacter indicus]SFI38600.1 hypothetical protein SAMN05444682_103473 [Parapedobacter indicus]